MANQPQQPDTALHNASHLMQYHDLIESIVAALDARDAYTASHSDRVADMVLVLAAALGLDEDETTRIHMAAHLHDIGKIAIDEKILNKPGRLTPEEFELVKTHSMRGAEMLHGLEDFAEQPLLQTAYEIARWHHERWDGRGYPDGLKGDEIPISAQLVSLADVYDALTSERCYKKAFSHEKAVQMIRNGECGAFNPLLLQCLTDIQADLKEELQQHN